MSWLATPANDLQVTHGARLWLYLLAAFAMFFLILPTLIVIPMSFSDAAYLHFPPAGWSWRWYEAYIASPEWTGATLTSLKVAALTVAVAIPVGTAAAYAASRASRPVVTTIYAFALLPLVVPVILLGIGIYLIYARIGLLNNAAALAVAHAVLAVPLVFLVMVASFRQADPGLELAARGLGAARWRAFVLVGLPQVRVGIMTASVLAFLTSLDEVVVALLIADGDAATVTRRMFLALRDQIDPVIAAISTLMIAVSVMLVVTVHMVRLRRDQVTY